jgi:glycerol-3-phosphate dehydrogenase
MEHEFCHSLEDYLRRRTNIAQWVPREGLGRQDENLDFLRRAALVFARQDVQVAMRAVNEYRDSVGKRFDAVLAAAS